VRVLSVGAYPVAVRQNGTVMLTDFLGSLQRVDQRPE
jgi:hypothetical protein